MNIAFIVAFPFPYGSASSMRARSIYRLLELAGHSVHVISDAASYGEVAQDEAFSCESIYDNCSSFIRRQRVAKKSVDVLKRYCRKNDVGAVLTNARYDRFNQIAVFCRKNNIKLIVENCEWYDKSSFKLGGFDLRFLKNQQMIKKGFKKADGLISISRFLDSHNKSFGKKSVRIPTILDVESTEYSKKTENEKVTIVYTGNPGKSKEFLRPVCEALAENENLRKRIELHIYGPSRDVVITNIGDAEILDKAGSSVIVHGRVPQGEVQGILMRADYLIFLRPDRRSSHAGFPTKLGESFAVGTPVIANDTGDLSLYIKDGENGFLLGGYGKEEVESVLYRISDISDEEYQKIRENARKTAEESFDFRRYIEEIKELF